MIKNKPKNYYLPKTDGTLERISVPNHFKERLSERFPNVEFQQIFSKSELITQKNVQNDFLKKKIKNKSIKLYFNSDLSSLIIVRKLKFRPTQKYPIKPIWWNDLILKTIYPIQLYK